MQISRKKATIRNISITFTYQIVTMILGFIIPRMFLTTYGSNIHGLTSSITNIMSYVLLLNAGLNTASIQALYKPLRENDNKRLNEVLNAIKKYYFNTGIVFTIAVIIIAIILPLFVEDISSIKVLILMLVMGLQSTLTSFLLSKNSVLLQADQKLYISNIFNIISLILRGIIQIILIYNNRSVIIVQAIPALMLILTMFMQNIYIKKYYPILDKQVKADKTALSNRQAAFIHQIAGVIVNNTDIFLLTIFTRDMTLVSIYSVYQLVFTNLYRLMTSVFSQGSVASFGSIMSIDNHDLVRENYNKYEFIYYNIVSIIYAVTSVMIIPFVKLYTSGTNGIQYVDTNLAILFIIIAVANNLRVPGSTLINAGGFYKETQKSAILESIINLVSSIILVKYLGIYGLLIGTILSFSYRTIDIIVYSNNKILKKSIKMTLKRAMKVIGIITFSNYYFNNILSLKIENWAEWLLYAIYVGIFSILVTIVINCITETDFIKKNIKGLKKYISIN